MSESPLNLLDQNQSPEIITAYRKLRTSTIGTFNQDNFTEIALIILKKPPEKRTSTDIKLLVECTKNVKFFQDLVVENGMDTHENCCKYMGAEFFQTGSTVFELGTAGSKFYIILKGSVGIFVNIPKTIEEINEKGETTQHVEYFLTDVRTLQMGASFGELALIDNRPRAATVICKSNCYFAVLEKDHFNLILKEKEKKKLEVEIEFLTSLDFISSWPYNSIKKLYYHTAIKSYSHKSVIYKELDESLYFYIIRAGEFQIDVPVELPLEGSLLFKQKFEKKQNKYSVCSKNTIKKYLKFAILGKNEYFGFEELVSNSRRNNRVVCKSEYGEVSVVNKKEFLRRVWGDPKTQENLQRIINQNNELKQKRINELLSIEQNIGFLRKPTVFDEYQLTSDEGKQGTGISQGYLMDSKMFDSTNLAAMSIADNSLRVPSIEKKNLNLPSVLLNEKKNIVLKKILPIEGKKRQSISEFSAPETSTLKNKLKTRQTFHEQEPPSILKLLEESHSHPSDRIKTEISHMNETLNNSNLLNFAQNHEYSMNLHRKMKSLEFQAKNMFSETSHITSKIDIIQEIRSSFKPIEIMKLKAFQKLNQKQRGFENYSKFRKKKKMEDYQNFFIPKIVQRSLQEKMQINKTLDRLISRIESCAKKTRFLNLGTEEKLLEIERRRMENKKKDYLKRDSSQHHRVRSLNSMNKDLLPLKYNIEKYERKKKGLRLPERIQQN